MVKAHGRTPRRSIKRPFFLSRVRCQSELALAAYLPLVGDCRGLSSARARLCVCIYAFPIARKCDGLPSTRSVHRVLCKARRVPKRPAVAETDERIKPLH